MTRHRGLYDRHNTEPYELSRSRIENFIRCPACFYLQQVRGVKFPSMPGFNINEATDVLLKREFAHYRQTQTTHPFLKNLGMDHLVPYRHDDFERWTQSLHFGARGRFNTIHKQTNLKIGGGLDDVWLNTKTGCVHIVDYKSTSQRTPGKQISLEDWWKSSYKRQMDIYIWVMLKLGIKTSATGYFLYCDGDRFTDQMFLGAYDARMQFKVTLLPYDANLSWIEPALFRIKSVLSSKRCPSHGNHCEYGTFIDGVKNL